MRWIRRTYDWVLAWSDSRHARPALFLLAAAEASFFPVPPDVLLMAMCLARPEASLGIAAIALAGSVGGGALGYLVGFGLWQAVSGFFFDWIPGFTPEGFARVQQLFEQYGFLTVFTAGFTPIPYKIITISSGVFGINFVVFLVASVVSRGLRFYLVAGLLRLFGPPVRAWIDRYFNLLSLIFVALLIGGFLVARYLL
ncbi:MAG: DedA family protein [Deltaproteobacteria bacterium]|nr:MAG: DedA family protein [Deltaproteobacteria bacterium]